MRHPIALAGLFLAATVAFAQQAPGTPPAAPPPGEGQPVTPTPTPQSETPGMTPGTQPDPSAPPPANPTTTAPTPGSNPGQMPPASGSTMGGAGRMDAPMPGVASSAPRAGGDYPVCSRDQRDGCRQPDGRRIPAPR